MNNVEFASCKSQVLFSFKIHITMSTTSCDVAVFFQSDCNSQFGVLQFVGELVASMYFNFRYSRKEGSAS